ncbi:hypothetical protein [Methylogaea oryzae]|uniref:DUF5343 domain-containing protein n=1 Tax=Methylogaea oryzae TaxID=1295382 RepID=A0A8D4VRN6_9GAMM|nr:hypothetical protein [Methylogaea oryzae]BBL72606.1 hypothetical protein MoryE10_32120 [Methylogaea oryzae]
MAEEFNLPGSSFEEVQKIIKGYSHAPENSTLESLSKLIGLHLTIISRNNKFLTDIGLITGGMKKTATDLGKRLGRALDHKQAEDGRRYWKEAVQTNEKVSGLVTTVRIKGGMSEKDFSDHVLYVSGQKNNAGNRTGARCVVDVLLAAGLLQEADGKLNVAIAIQDPEISTPATIVQPLVDGQIAPTIQPPVAPVTASLPPIATSITPQIAINIQLHLPETENAEVYEKLFKALKEHLLPKA